MATSESWRRVPGSSSPISGWFEGAAPKSSRGARGAAKLWMVLDWMIAFASALLTTIFSFHSGFAAGIQRLLQGAPFHGRSMGLLLAILCGFALSLVMISRQLHLYTPARLPGFWHEQRLSVQACLTSGLLLTGALYMLYASDIPRSFVVATVGLVTVMLSSRRLAYRMLICWRFERGVDTRNVLIIGTGPEAHALRKHLEGIKHLGYRFKGFIDFPNSAHYPGVVSTDVVGSMDTLFQHARKEFVDEIFFSVHCERETVQTVLQQARAYGVDLHVVPEMYDEGAWNNPIEYIGQFPTIPLHRGRVPEIALLLKRFIDITLACLILILIFPLLLIIAMAVKIDSRGPILYSSERIGKKGRVFRCIKFRTMVRDAEGRRAEIMHMNERDGVLFKVSNDPRITRVGRMLRKYSLDEIPQFFNVLQGDMSIVGPRPPIASEVQGYKLSHLRRLDVMPGITGLWQVQARQDPSFDNYISLDVNYVENWNIWLDLKIIARTIGVVFAGTGS